MSRRIYVRQITNLILEANTTSGIKIKYVTMHRPQKFALYFLLLYYLDKMVETVQNSMYS